MKNILLIAGLLMVSMLSFAQNPTYEILPVNESGLENVVVETITNANHIPAGYTVYRVYADLATDYTLLGVYASNATIPTSPLFVEATNGEFYNDANGSITGSSLSSALFGVPTFEASRWDSYVTIGAAAGGRIGVPYSLNNTYDEAGSTFALTIPTSIADLITPVLGTAVSSDRLEFPDGLWATNGAGVNFQDIDSENRVMVAQFTCSANLTFNLSFSTQFPGGGVEYAKDVYYSNYVSPNVDPTITAVSPNNNVALGVQVPTTFEVTAEDTDGSISSVEFFVDGNSVGTGVAGAANAYTFEYTPAAEGTFSYYAVATDDDDATAQTPTFTLTVSDPNPTTLSLNTLAAQISGEDLPIDLSVNVSDADGIAQVEYFANGSTIGVVSASPWTLSWSPDFGTYEIYAVSTDQSAFSRTATSNTVSTEIYNPSSFYNLGGDVTVPCYADNKFCVPFTRINTDMADINGFDIIMQFESEKVVPTGVITLNSDLVDRDLTDYTTRVQGDSLFISVYLKGNAPIGTFWAGQGEIFCVEFARTSGFMPNDNVTFGVNTLVESYEDTAVDQIAGAESAVYSIFVDDIFEAQLIFWADGSAISGNANNTSSVTYALTTLGNATVGARTEPDVDGIVEFDFIQGNDTIEYVNIEKDVPASTPMDTMIILINGYDAYLTTRVLTEDPTFEPSVFQIMAMDVNLDGRVTAGDVSQMNQRAVNIRTEFENGNGTDWIYVNNEALQNYGRFRISRNYPLEDADQPWRFYKDNVPASVTDYRMIGAKDDCPDVAPETFQMILLGDVDGTYRHTEVDGSLKGASAVSEIVFNVNNAKVSGEYVNVPVSINAGDVVRSASFTVAFDNDKAEFVSAQSYADYIKMTPNAIENTVAVVSNTISVPYEERTTLFNLRFKVDNNDVSNLGLEAKVATVNGSSDNAIATITGVTTAIENEIADAVQAYPVPVKDVLKVESPEDAIVQLFNVNGTLVKEIEVYAGSIEEINVTELTDGLYILKVYNENFTSVKRVVVSK